MLAELQELPLRVVREEQYQLLVAQVAYHLQQEQEEVEVLEIPVQQQVRVLEVWVAHLQCWELRLEKAEQGVGLLFLQCRRRKGVGASLPKRIEPHLGELGEGGAYRQGWEQRLEKGEQGVDLIFLQYRRKKERGEDQLQVMEVHQGMKEVRVFRPNLHLQTKGSEVIPVKVIWVLLRKQVQSLSLRPPPQGRHLRKKGVVEGRAMRLPRYLPLSLNQVFQGLGAIQLECLPLWYLLQRWEGVPKSALPGLN